MFPFWFKKNSIVPNPNKFQIELQCVLNQKTHNHIFFFVKTSCQEKLQRKLCFVGRNFYHQSKKLWVLADKEV